LHPPCLWAQYVVGMNNITSFLALNVTCTSNVLPILSCDVMDVSYMLSLPSLQCYGHQQHAVLAETIMLQAQLLDAFRCVVLWTWWTTLQTSLSCYVPSVGQFGNFYVWPWECITWLWCLSRQRTWHLQWEFIMWLWCFCREWMWHPQVFSKWLFA